MSEVGIRQLRSVAISTNKYHHHVKRFGISCRSLREDNRGICMDLLDALEEI